VVAAINPVSFPAIQYVSWTNTAGASASMSAFLHREACSTTQDVSGERVAVFSLPLSYT